MDEDFQEDHHQLRTDRVPENFAVLRHITLNMLNQDKTVKTGIKAKRLRVGWNHYDLLKILAE